MAHLSLSLLGPFQVTLVGQPVTDFKSNKVRALLAYLAVEADWPHRREDKRVTISRAQGRLTFPANFIMWRR